MAVRIKELDIDPLKKEYKCSIFADSKDDVTPDLADKLKIPKDAHIAWGSSVFTADGDIAFLKSDGTWNWVE